MGLYYTLKVVRCLAGCAPQGDVGGASEEQGAQDRKAGAQIHTLK
jgi:hypothetical protein